MTDPLQTRLHDPVRPAASPSGKVGVLLFNLGGPEDLQSVEPFLVKLFSDRDIIELPLGAVTQPIFAWLVAKLRGPSVRRNYALIGGGSPQLRLTRAQAEALETRLNRPHGGSNASAPAAAAGVGAGASSAAARAAGAPGGAPPRGDQVKSVDLGVSSVRPASSRGLDGAAPSEPPAPIGGSAATNDPETVRGRLGSAPGQFRVFIAMRYWRPSTEDALAEVEREGIRRVVTLTLFPHWSKATTGSSQKELERALARPSRGNRGLAITGVDRYADDPLYLDAFADTVRRAFDGFPPASRERVVILFSAHGLPQKFVDEGDPYIEQIEATRRGLLDRLQLPNRHLLGYQSRTGPVKWIGPGTDELIAKLGAEGVKEVLVVPLSFVSDHIETLYEVDLLFGEMARKAGITDYRRPEALNTHPLFIEALAQLVERHLADG